MSKSMTNGIERELVDMSIQRRPVDEAGFSVKADAVFGSMPVLSRRAVQVARLWQGVSDDVTDEDVLAQGIIPPELIELIMAIVQTLLQDCLDNRPSSSWGRIRGYLDGRERDRLGDNTRLNWLVDRWVVRLGVARDRGDVVEIRRALISTVNGMTEKDFQALQAEVLFLTI